MYVGLNGTPILFHHVLILQVHVHVQPMYVVCPDALSMVGEAS
jgi:hypothetical protein